MKLIKMEVKYFDSSDLLRRFEKRVAEVEEDMDERLKSLRVVIHFPCSVCKKDMPYLLDTSGVIDIPDGPSFVKYHCKECNSSESFTPEEVRIRW